MPYPKTPTAILLTFTLCAFLGCRAVPERPVCCEACLADAESAAACAVDADASHVDALPVSNRKKTQATPVGVYLTDEVPQSDTHSPSQVVREATTQLPSNAPPGLPVPSTGVQSNPPTVIGERLSTSQITATEHALRLKEENTRLKTIGRSLIAENERQTTKIKEHEALIDRLTKAMALAEKELTNAQVEISAMREKILILERRLQDKQLATDRMLNSIQVELDDALMGEFIKE